MSREELIASYQHRVSQERTYTAATGPRLRDQLMREHGALDYDQIEGEFRKLSRHLGWPAAATLKGSRHLFSTSLENSHCPTSYRQYFKGQSQGRAAIVRYTHLDELARHFGEFLATTYAPIITELKVNSVDSIE